MEVLAKRSELQLCPCYKEYQEFQKLVELKDYGLVIYCHRRRTENIRPGEAVDGAVNTSRDVFILHNKKDVKVTTLQLTSELEKENISCPRCRKKIQHAQELMKDVKSLDRRIVMGICDHCRKKALVSENPFCVCKKIVKLFKTAKGEPTEGTKKYVKVLPSESGHLRKYKQQEIRAYSDLQIKRDTKPPAAEHEPDVQQMFYSDTHFQSDDTEISETDSKEGYIKQSKINFIEPVKPKETPIVHTPHASEKINTTSSGVSLVGSVTTFVDTYVGVKELPRPSIKDRKQKEIFEDIPSKNAKEELKRRHDLSLRQIVKFEKDSGVPISISKRPGVYETPKIAPWEQKQPIPKNVESETEIKNIQTKQERVSSGPVGKMKKPEQRVTKSKSKPVAAVGSVVKPQFSYFFPKVKEKKVKQMAVKSSELIKKTYDNYKKRKEQKRQQNQEQGQNKKLSQRDKSKEILLGEEVAKKDKKLKPVQKEKDAAEEKSNLGDKGEENKFDTAKGEKLNSKKGERDGKLQRDKQVEIEKLSNKKRLTEKDNLKEEKQMKEKVASAKTEKSIKSIRGEDKVEEVSIKKKNGEEIKESPKDQKEIEEFKRLQAEHLKAKAIQKALLNKQKPKQQTLLDAQKPKQEAESEAKLKKIRINQSSQTDQFLKLVKIKQTTKISPFVFNNVLLKAHTGHLKRGQKLSACPVCLDSELELEFFSIDYERNLKKDKMKDIIVGEKIYKYKPGLEKTKKPEGVVPIVFQKDVFLESDFQGKVQIIPQEANAVQNKILANDVLKMDKVVEANAGIIRYALSDRTFIDKGWTVLPTEKVLRMMNVYRMRPARPEFDWFKNNKDKGLMTYDTGERLAEFDDKGRGRWYYRNGRLALDYYDAEETNAQQRFVIYSSGEPDERGRTHPITILATFDYLGNGIVFDHAGKIRLKYNQTEGVVLDRAIGPVSHWKWHTLNDPPVLQQVMIDTQVAHKDPDILKLGSPADVKNQPENEEMLAIEFDNFIKEKSKKLSQTFKPFQIKMKALKINEYFSLKVLDQATVYLIFRDGLTNLKVNMGMILDEKEIVDTDAAEMGEVSNSLERFPARTDSLAGLQRSVAYARRYERQHAERERRLRPPEPSASTDLMTAAASVPMRLAFRTVPTGSSSTTRCCSIKPS